VLDQLITECEAAAGAEELADAVAELSHRALQHLFAEETVLLPACREHLGAAGVTWANSMDGTHRELHGLLTSLGGEEIGPESALAVTQVIALLRSDAREEEDQLLPRLQAVLSAEDLRVLGAAWQAARRAAPFPAPRRVSRPAARVNQAPRSFNGTAEVPAVEAAAQAPGRSRLVRTLGSGLVAGAAGVAVLMLTEKLYSLVTGAVGGRQVRRRRP
jgi:hypothetical protein